MFIPENDDSIKLNFCNKELKMLKFKTQLKINNLNNFNLTGLKF